VEKKEIENEIFLHDGTKLVTMAQAKECMEIAFFI
jgi:hypothetical protein